MMITSRERDLAEQEQPGEDHPVLPEADDLARRHVDVTRVVALELRRLARASRASRTATAPRRTTCRGRRGRARARPSRTRRTHRAAATRTSGGRRGTSRSGSGAPTRAAARRTSRAPARATRSRSGAGSPGGSERAAPRAPRSPARASSSIAAPPLRRDERLDPRVAALAGADRVPVVLALLELAVLASATSSDARRRPPPASSPSKPSAVMRPSGPITVSVGRSWSRPISKSIGIVARRDLQRARAELGLDARVRDHRDAPPDDRDDDLLADRVGVARVVRVHGDRDVGEDRRRAARWRS